MFRRMKPAEDYILQFLVPPGAIQFPPASLNSTSTSTITFVKAAKNRLLLTLFMERMRGMGHPIGGHQYPEGDLDTAELEEANDE